MPRVAAITRAGATFFMNKPTDKFGAPIEAGDLVKPDVGRPFIVKRSDIQSHGLRLYGEDAEGVYMSAWADECERVDVDMPQFPRYEGPFNPPPADLLEDAIAWEFDKEYPEPGRWRPKGWNIVYPGGIKTYTLCGLCIRDRSLFAP